MLHRLYDVKHSRALALTEAGAEDGADGNVVPQPGSQRVTTEQAPDAASHPTKSSQHPNSLSTWPEYGAAEEMDAEVTVGVAVLGIWENGSDVKGGRRLLEVGSGEAKDEIGDDKLATAET